MMITHVEEGAGMFQYELTGVRFVLTVININVELISLENRRGGEIRFYRVIFVCSTQA